MPPDVAHHDPPTLPRLIMFCPSGCLKLLARELSVLAALLSVAASANANNDWTHDIATLPQTAAREPLADSGTKIISLTDLTEYRYDEESTEELPSDVVPGDEYLLDAWSWQWLPAGLIYHSYMAGVHEPRMGIVAFHEGEGRTLWDATLGGRVGLLRYGDCRTMVPEGYQLDFYGAAVARLDVEHRQDLDSTDYVFGFPLTYGIGNTQLKLGYAHLSSHLGDELAIREPGTLSQRINYVRDSIVFGASHFPFPIWRLYGEVGWAFHNSGGAQPWDSQFGTELTQPGATGESCTPFLAVNGRVREEHDFAGDVTVQAGWLRRGVNGQTLRLGPHYYNGKSSQFQFNAKYEEQVGLGVWYDF
jgi:hypothetical protein